LRPVLTDDVLLEEVEDLARLGQVDEPEFAGLGQLLVDDLVAQVDALVADVHAGTRDELLDLLLALPAERALEQICSLTSRHAPPPSRPLLRPAGRSDDHCPSHTTRRGVVLPPPWASPVRSATCRADLTPPSRVPSASGSSGLSTLDRPSSPSGSGTRSSLTSALRLGFVRPQHSRPAFLTLRLRHPLVPHECPPPRVRQASALSTGLPHPPAPAPARPSRVPSASGSSGLGELGGLAGPEHLVDQAVL